MVTVNNITVSGVITNEPEIKVFDDTDTKFQANIEVSIAWNKQYQDKNDQQQTITEYFKVRWRFTNPDKLEEFQKKLGVGNRLYVENGVLRSWKSTSNNQYWYVQATKYPSIEFKK